MQDKPNRASNADYEEVVQRVARARERKARSLSLSNYAALEHLPNLSGLDKLEEFSVRGSGLTSLAPLTSLRNLKRLRVLTSKIVDISALAALKSLVQLDLWENPDLSNLTALKDLTRLRSLDLSFTAVSDISPLRNLKNLNSLRLSTTDVGDLSPISELPNLKYLDLDNSQKIKDISPLQTLSLYNLIISGTSISDISPISQNRYLRFLNIEHTTVSNLKPISDLRHLRYAEFSNTAISDLDSLSKSQSLESINIDQTNVSDLSAISGLKNLEYLSFRNSKVRDLSPLARMESLYRHALKSKYSGGIDFGGAAIADSNLSAFSQLENPERTVKTINYLREQQELRPYSEEIGQSEHQNQLLPMEGVPSAFAFRVSERGNITLESTAANPPIFPLRTSETDFKNRLSVCRAVANELIADLKSGRFQARSDYVECLSKYEERLPEKRDDGNILLADAEARTIRNMFASEVDILSIPLASRLKTFLEQHMGLRVFYPEISNFYRDVQHGRIQEPLSLDAVDGFLQTVRRNTPTIFDDSVEEALEGTSTSSQLPTVASTEIATGDSSQPRPPKDPLGEINPNTAADYTFAGAANRLWKVFLEGERINRSVEAWRHAAQSLRPYVSEILDWLHRFTPPGS